MKGTTKLTRGCGTLFPPGTTLEQAKAIIAPPAAGVKGLGDAPPDGGQP